MSERKPPDPEAVAPRRVADGAGKAIGKALPTNGDGLGPIGESVVKSLIDDSEQEEERHRLFMRFTPRWRAIIRWFEDEKLDDLQEIVRLLDGDKRTALAAILRLLDEENRTALRDILEDYVERRVLRVFWKRVWGSLVIIVPSAFAAAQYGVDRIPLIRDIIKIVRGLFA